MRRLLLATTIAAAGLLPFTALAAGTLQSGSSGGQAQTGTSDTSQTGTAGQTTGSQAGTAAQSGGASGAGSQDWSSARSIGEQDLSGLAGR